MIQSRNTLTHYVEKFYNERTLPRKAAIAQNVQEIGKIVNDILNVIGLQEPRFASVLNEINGRYEGLEVISPTKYEVVLFLTNMGVFTFIDEGATPGCAALKLSDGRKRSMSLWVEFITASGYLSSRKLRTRLQGLIGQALEKMSYRDVVRLGMDNTDLILIIKDRITVRLTPAFRCGGMWPITVSHWPVLNAHSVWPPPSKIMAIKAEGLNLYSKEIPFAQDKKNPGDSDAWVMSFAAAEDRLIEGGCRKKCLSILKTLRDRHLDFPGSPLNNYHMKTMLLYECDKHQLDTDWNASSVGDRLQGILLQLVSCLRCRRLSHYFQPMVDLFENSPPGSLDAAAKQVWCLAREIITNSKSFEHL